MGKTLQRSVGFGSALDGLRVSQISQIAQRAKQSGEGRAGRPRRLGHGEHRFGDQQRLQHTVRKASGLEGSHVSPEISPATLISQFNYLYFHILYIYTFISGFDFHLYSESLFFYSEFRQLIEVEMMRTGKKECVLVIYIILKNIC